MLRHEIFRREPVGHVEREIAHQPALAGEKAEVVVIADEVAVGLGGTHLLENPILAGLENARRRDADRASRFDAVRREHAEPPHGFPVRFRVLEITMHRARARRHRRVELREVAHEDGKLRAGGAAAGRHGW